MATSWQPTFQQYTNLQSRQAYTTSIDAARNQAVTFDVHQSHHRVSGGQGAQHSLGPNLQNERAAVHHSDLPLNRLAASEIRRAQNNEPTQNTFEDESVIQPRSTQGPSHHALLSLSHPRYGLPPKIIENIEKLGVHSIYPWQSSCLLGKGLLDGQQNLIYTAPTGGGKSLVADIILLRRVLENPTKKALVVLPYVALVQEKMRWLRCAVEDVVVPLPSDLLTNSTRWQPTSKNIRVVGFYGGSKSKSTWDDCDIAVCTIEKANSIVNTAIEEGQIDNLAIVVVDELHMLDDEHRGYIMELMMTKFMCVQAGIQVVGMSATLSNPKLLADWLRAKFYVSKYRPIPIDEYLVYDNSIYPTASSKDFFRTANQLTVVSPTQRLPDPSHIIAQSTHQELKIPMVNAVVALAIETATSGYGALVFCSSRQGAQTMASLISEAMPAYLVDAGLYDRRLDVLASLQALPGGFEATFAKTILAGVGFHHAGLTVEERELVADAYDSGVLKIMVATASLAAGINLPARRVILYGARMGRELVGPAMLRQMRGRAGRKGKDEVGEAFLCCQKAELEAVAEMLEAELPAVVSCLTSEKRGLKRAILEVVATRLASSYVALQEYVQRSLLWQTTDHGIVLTMLDSAIRSLLEASMIEEVMDHVYMSTRLGSAIVASALTPEDGLFVHADLQRALSSFVMDTELHIFYLFTPIPQPSPAQPITSDISWPTFRVVLDSLDEASLRAIRLIGVNPAVVNNMANSGQSDMKERSQEETDTARIYRRVYSTLALRDICNEVPIHTISLKYGLARGQIQNLAQSCHGFAAGMIKFCQRMASPQPLPPDIQGYTLNTTTTSFDPNSTGFSMLSVVLDHMLDRLRAGARADLLEMAQVTFVKGRMARMLYEAGFKGVRALAEADPKRDIVPVMMMVSGWKTKRRGGEDGGEWDIRRLKLEENLLQKAEILVGSAGRLWERECLKQLDEE